MLLKLKKGQVDSNIQMATMYQTMGQVEKAAKRIETVQALLNHIVSLETEMYDLKNGGSAVSTDAPEVSMFLEKGRKAMGIVNGTSPGESV